VIALALFQRFRSRQQDTFGDRMLAMMRQQFGGHPVQAAEPVAQQHTAGSREP